MHPRQQRRLFFGRRLAHGVEQLYDLPHTRCSGASHTLADFQSQRTVRREISAKD
jgi:hypothetical protein